MNPATAIFTACSASGAVWSALGDSNRLRVFPFGNAPQNGDKPYCVWQVVTGSPENYINQTPDLDRWSVQFDTYGRNASEVWTAAEAVQNAVETTAHVVSYRGQEYESATGLYRVSFDVEWMVGR
jgi:hypothetical protein